MTESECLVLKSELDFSKDVCLFVTHSVDCAIKPHVAYHVRALVSAGFQVVLILNTDNISVARRVLAFPAPSGIIVRKNEGFDFGAWADVLRLHPSLWVCPRLLLVNDSVIGPVKGGALLFPRLRSVEADMVGLVESYEHVRHFQSFFLLMNSQALRNGGVREFWKSVVNLKRKTEVIRAYELTFTAHCLQSGLRTRALHQQSPLMNTIKKTNPTIIHWRELTLLGFPYVKVELVRDRLTPKGLILLKRLIGDPDLFPFIDSFASMRELKRP